MWSAAACSGPAQRRLDARAVGKRLGGEAERLWEIMIKGLGKLLGLGAAPACEAESDDDAETGPKVFHVSCCSVVILRDTRFLSGAAGRSFYVGMAQMLL